MIAELVLAALDSTRRAGGDASSLWEAWNRPWKVAIIGATSVGKTTLVNRLAGARLPTGFGGVTREVREVAVAPGLVLVDTPGIDGPCAWLTAVLAESDAAIWVIDPLRALGWSEREEVAAAWPDGLALHCLVRRLRTDPAEEAEVLERVRLVTDRWAPRSLVVQDLLRDPPPSRLLIRSGTGPSRAAALARAIEVAAASVAAEDPAPWREGWRAAVREVRRGAEELLARSDAPDPELALLRAAERAALPAWPVPTVRAPRVRSEAGSVAANQRILRAAAARWLAEGELALLTWLRARDASRAEAREALAALARSVAQPRDAGHSDAVR